MNISEPDLKEEIERLKRELALYKISNEVLKTAIQLSAETNDKNKRNINILTILCIIEVITLVAFLAGILK
jgi:hypothetical protein